MADGALLAAMPRPVSSPRKRTPDIHGAEFAGNERLGLGITPKIMGSLDAVLRVALDGVCRSSVNGRVQVEGWAHHIRPQPFGTVAMSGS